MLTFVLSSALPPDPKPLQELLYVAGFLSCLAFILSETKIFRPLRDSLRGVPGVGKAVNCGFCLCFWLSLSYELFFGGTTIFPLDVWWRGFADVVLLHWASAFFWVIMCVLLKLADK